jgi:hypothetical protein
MGRMAGWKEPWSVQTRHTAGVPGAGRAVGNFAFNLQVIGRPEGAVVAEGFQAGAGVGDPWPASRPHCTAGGTTVSGGS